MIILDTDCLSLMDRERSIESSILRHALDKFNSEDIFATIVSFEEHMRGWLSFIAKSRSLDKQIYAYGKLHRFLESYRETQVLDFDERAAAEFTKLKAAKIRVGTMDLKIASIAIANNAILITRNLADFERVPDLIVEDWT